MLKNKKPTSVLEIVALGYLFIPVFIFMLSWIKLWISIPVVILVLVALCKMLFDKGTDDSDQKIKISSSFIVCSVICFVLILLLSYFLGAGGFTAQPFDSIKHNFILSDLIGLPWPVHYQMGGDKGVLCYYIAGYLVPALVGKITYNFDIASAFSAVWHAIGIFIAILVFYSSLSNKRKPAHLLVIFAVIMLFAPFNALMQFLYMIIYPDRTVTAFHFQWISEDINVQLSSNLTLLRYVFPQFVPSLIVVSLLFKLRKRYDKWAFIASPLLSFSVFAFMGIVELMLVLFVFDMIKDKNVKKSLRSILSLENIAGVVSASLFLLYLAGNILQPKPSGAENALKLVDYSELPLVLLLHEIAWGLWLIFLFKTNKKEPLLWAVSLCLFIFPFLEFGHYNDLCIRGSMPALLCLCFLLAKDLTGALGSANKRLLPTAAIVIALLLSGIFPALEEMHLPENKSILSQEYYWDEYSNSLSFFTEYEWTRYQYINWEENSISNFILR